MVEYDGSRGVLDDERRAVVAAGAFTLVDNLSDYEDSEEENDEEGAKKELDAENA